MNHVNIEFHLNQADQVLFYGNLWARSSVVWVRRHAKRAPQMIAPANHMVAHISYLTVYPIYSDHHCQFLQAYLKPALPQLRSQLLQHLSARFTIPLNCASLPTVEVHHKYFY